MEGPSLQLPGCAMGAEGLQFRHYEGSLGDPRLDDVGILSPPRPMSDHSQHRCKRHHHAGNRRNLVWPWLGWQYLEVHIRRRPSLLGYRSVYDSAHRFELLGGTHPLPLIAE